jgi:hypothetical protein
MAEALKFRLASEGFADCFSSVSVHEVSGNGFSAFVYKCKLNLDLDGSRYSYGYYNPSGGVCDLQRKLDPLESWHKGWKGVSTARSQKVGLGNAAGHPGDGTKGHENFLAGNRKFYWVGIMALRKKDAGSHLLDERPELEAGLDQNYEGYFKKNGKLPALLPVGSGYFPVIQMSGPTAGYYISSTSVAVDDGDQYDPGHYLDPEKVPYAVWANLWLNLSAGGKKVSQGDFGIAIRLASGAHTGYVYGDCGTPNKVGESSQKLHTSLSASGDTIAFIAFPGSGRGQVMAKNPETSIRPAVLSRTTSLGSNANDLAMFLATGRTNTHAHKELTSLQARAYNNIYAALADWTIVSS